MFNNVKHEPQLRRECENHVLRKITGINRQINRCMYNLSAGRTKIDNRKHTHTRLYYQYLLKVADKYFLHDRIQSHSQFPISLQLESTTMSSHCQTRKKLVLTQLNICSHATCLIA